MSHHYLKDVQTLPSPRLYAGHGTLLARAHPSPHPVFVRQESPGPLHRLLDPQPLRPLGGQPAA